MGVRLEGVPAHFLAAVSREIFIACGAPPDEASLVAEHLVNSNLMGVDSHGVLRIPEYVDRVHRGAIVPGAPIVLTQEQSGTAIVDCGLNFGQVGASRAMQLAIEKASRYKVSCVVTRRCTHVGRLGHYSRMAADAGMVGLITVNSSSEGHDVVPFGGVVGRLATNPLSYAIPAPGPPLVADMSTSTVAEGKIRLYRNLGQELPPGWIIDGAGNPSTDPRAYYGNWDTSPQARYGSDRGWILSLGGDLGYKGYALSLMVEILSGALSGELYNMDVLDGGQGVCCVVIDISAFMPLDRFRKLVGELIAYVKSAPVAPGFQEILMPGEPDFRTLEERQAKGIPLDPNTWQQIRAIAESLHVQIVEPVLRHALSAVEGAAEEPVAEDNHSHADPSVRRY
jgi:uncharacterized oxidoreductase